MHSLAPRVAVAALLFALAAPLIAATYVIPPDAEFIRSADAIAIVKIESSRSYYSPDGSIWTDYTAVVERSLKSPLKAETKITITLHGGVVGGRELAVSSEPRFTAGERTLVVLDRQQPGRFRIASGELGKFSFVSDAESRNLLVRGAGEGEIFGWDLSGRSHVERPRDAAAFVRYIEAVVAGQNPAADYFVRESVVAEPSVRSNAHVASGQEYLSRSSQTGRGGRWRTNGFSIQNTNNQGAENGGTVTQNAAALWNNIGSANINIQYAGVNPSGQYGVGDTENYVLFNQPDNHPSGDLSGSTVGVAQFWFDHPSQDHQFAGTTYHSLVDCDVLVEIGFSGSLLNAILGHELGHCLGFRHSNTPAAGQVTSTTDALMNSSVSASSTIRDWDTDAASHVYGDGAPPPCNAPTIQTHPQSQTITAGGNGATLSVTAGGTAPFTYQWFEGQSGDTNTPINGATSSTLSRNPSATTSYWVRVGHECSTATVNSNTATITVEPFVCPQVQVGTPVAQQLNASTYRLSVNVNSSGRPIASYEWYEGNTPGTPGTFVGSGSSINVPAPTVNKSYWVNVTNDCGNSAFSALVTIVGVCPTPVINTQPQDQTVTAGQQVTLTIGATGATSINWYRGESGDKSALVGSGATLNLAVVNTTTRFWASLVNNCGETQSRTVVITVQVLCTAPAITAQSPPQKVSLGKTVTLSVTATGTGPLTYQWYQGPVNTITTPVGTNSPTFTSEALKNSTQFWVKVTNSCGSTNSNAIAVTVDKGRSRRAVGHR
jgi:Ig-like domain CHU_C associated